MTHKVSEPIKIAIFVHSCLDTYTQLYTIKEHDPKYSSFTRISEWVEVVFPPRLPDEVLTERVQNIDREIQDTMRTAMTEIDKLKSKKEELLAITFDAPNIPESVEDVPQSLVDSDPELV